MVLGQLAAPIKPEFYPSPYDAALEEIREWRELPILRMRPRDHGDIEAGSHSVTG